jgi:uncharacterized LabA/DUF88 family protein
MNPGVHRAYYFTSAVGDDPALHSIKITLRNFDLEPYVFSELKQQARQRQNVLEGQQLIEKPKGVDIELTVRMMEDSATFDKCHLYTSDSDFLPVIRAVRARGKQVIVHGYKAGLSSQSGLLHECDLFVDLEEMLRKECEIDRKVNSTE